MTLEIASVRQDFPVIAQRTMNGKPLAYLDSGATAQKPQCVIDAVARFYSHDYASINRGVYELAEQTTQAYEAARKTVAGFIGCDNPDQLVFTSGTTESINLVAHGLAANYLQPGDEIILSQMEHHANIVPWQLAAEKVGAVIRVAPLTDEGELDLPAFAQLINAKTKLITIIHVSNVMGSVVPVEAVIELAKANGIPTLIDGAQAVAHLPVDVSQLGCDFYVFSAHKLYGPTGVGALYAKADWLERMPPYQAGGDMIRRVSFEKTTFAAAPHKFEAGTPNIAGVIGFAEAVRYFTQFDWADKLAHEQALITYLDEGLRSIPGLQLFGPLAQRRKAVASFVFERVHAHDVGSFLGNEGVAVRVGHHCTMPLMGSLGVAATTRASLGIYSNQADVDALLQGLENVLAFFA
jgi:SufS family cysteine desulfurase